MDLLIDDQRTFCECIAKTYSIGMTILRTGRIDRLFLDFDLGETKTGLDVLKDGFKERVLPEFIQLVTMNPVGKTQMGLFLKDCNYETADNCNYFLRDKPDSVNEQEASSKENR